LHTDYVPEHDRAELIEHPDLRQQMSSNHRTYRDGQTGSLR